MHRVTNVFTEFYVSNYKVNPIKKVLVSVRINLSAGKKIPCMVERRSHQILTAAAPQLDGGQGHCLNLFAGTQLREMGGVQLMRMGRVKYAELRFSAGCCTKESRVTPGGDTQPVGLQCRSLPGLQYEPYHHHF